MADTKYGLVGLHEQCSRDESPDQSGSELRLRGVDGEWVHFECTACALEVSLRLPVKTCLQFWTAATNE